MRGDLGRGEKPETAVELLELKSEPRRREPSEPEEQKALL
jgi:hypothetical protein